MIFAGEASICPGVPFPLIPNCDADHGDRVFINPECLSRRRPSRRPLPRARARARRLARRLRLCARLSQLRLDQHADQALRWHIGLRGFGLERGM